MKKVLLLIASVLFITINASAQQDGVALSKAAGKALTAYNIDPTGNSAKLGEAISLIEQAIKTPEAQALSSAWLTKGDIYNTRLQNDMTKRIIDFKAPLTGNNDALVAFDAYKKCFGLSDKNYEKKDALRGIIEVQGALVNIGVDKYGATEYEKAFLSFRAVLESHDLLKKNGQKSVLDDVKQLDDQVYITGLAAMMAKREKDAFIYFDQLYRNGTDKPEVFENLYHIKLQMGDEEGAVRILSEGRKKYPDDPALLFAEINQFLKAGKLNELINMLKQAIAKEPDNISLYVTLGNVYDNLFQMELKEKNDTKANEYFEEAKKYYSQAIARDSKNNDAVYSLGALYYNKAAFLTQVMNALQEDFSKAGQEKMKAMRDEIMGLFDQALPYFKKAENLNPNDLNTLIALQEIFARKEDILFIEFKKRLDKVKAGGRNETSYF